MLRYIKLNLLYKIVLNKYYSQQNIVLQRAADNRDQNQNRNRNRNQSQNRKNKPMTVQVQLNMND